MFERLTKKSECADLITIKALCESCGEDACGDLCTEYLYKECKGCPVQEAFDRLAAYEDTGLTPERIRELQNAFNILFELESLRCTSCGEIPATIGTDDGQYCEKCAEELDAVEMIDLLNYHNPADVEALQQENEQLQAQVAQMREALEEATETIENIYEKDTPQTEKYRDMLNSSTQIEYHNPADVATLAKAREALEYANARRPNIGYFANCGKCKDCGQWINYDGKIVCDECYCNAIDEAIAAIDKIGGREDV
jgi:RNA polymerase-binding transcription factor DksA